jgi:tagatose-1,6-bisphosphate aldolase non-catalytic subunit AgaZ/GatZ
VKQYKLGVGPMSSEIIDNIVNYKNRNQLMVVASRNQVDFRNAYVCDSYALALRIKPAGILLCRDHCGPYFKDSDTGLDLEKALIEVKKTIKTDLLAGFDLIHIDTSKIKDTNFAIAKELIDFAIGLNPNILIEFGSEDNTGETILEDVARITPQLDFIKQYPNVKYFVTQTGSLTKDKQVGTFLVGPNTVLASLIHTYGFQFKEHNADYLTASEVALRTTAGIDAMNIAPQLGVIQTMISCALAEENDQWKIFADMVYKSSMWQRWVQPGINDKNLAVQVAGHYFFTSPEYKAVKETHVKSIFDKILTTAIHEVFDLYLGINNSNGETL